MKPGILLLEIGFILHFCFGETSQSGEKKSDPAQAETDKFEGSWIEVHAPAAKKTKGLGAYVVWSFKGTTAFRRFVQTFDGRPWRISSRYGSYKVDVAETVMAIDMSLKSDGEEERKYQGIYKFEGDILKLCVSVDNRPTKFEAKGDPRFLESKGEIRLYVLKRIPKE